MMIEFAVIYGLNTVVGLIGNLFVLLVVVLYRDFHNMRYFLLASLALSDFLMAVMVGHRSVANAVEEWIFGSTWCHGTAFLFRVLYLNTVFHLCAVSYERYNAIVRRPLAYSSSITMKRLFLNTIMLWVLPACISLGPFIGWGDFVYNPEIFACEQKWDGQTAIPLSIATFIVPLGGMVFLNYKVLKVVIRLQRSMEIINKSLSSPENKTPDYPNHHQQCSQDDQFGDRVQRHTKQQEEGAGVEKNEHSPHKHNINHCKEAQGIENAAYQADPADSIETMHQEEMVCGELRRTRTTQCRSYSLTDKPNNLASVKTREEGPNKINKKTVGNECSKGKKSLGQKKKRYSLDQVDALAKMDIQIHPTEESRSWNGTLKNSRGLQRESVWEVQIPKERSCSIQLPSIDQIITADANDMEVVDGSQSQSWKQSQVEVQKRRRSAKVSPKCETRIVDEQAPRKAQVYQVKSRRENSPRLSSLQGPSQYNNSEDLRKADIIESLPQDDDCQPNEDTSQKQPRPLGKTQIRLAKLLKEGKAARDVVIIIGAFVVCYLPVWIMAMYRASGGFISIKSILSVHWAYSLSMICNPIIYSIRKKEFRKALRKLLKL